MNYQNNKKYTAQAFHDSLPKGRSSGTLSFTPLGIHFSNGQQKVTIPYAELRISLGGASKRLVFFAHPNFRDWSIYTNDLSVTRDPILNSKTELARQLSKIRKGRFFNWSVTLGVLAVIVMIPVMLLVSMDFITAVIAKRVPIAWEEDIGEEGFQQYQIEHKLMEGEAFDNSLNNLTTQLIEKADKKYTFRIYVSNDPILNAFALPGGYIVLNSGLILAAESAEELLGVLAHEMAHVTQQHGIRNVIGSIGIYLTVQALLGDVSGLLAVVADAAPLLLNQKYSRHFESEADQLGVELLSKANIDPRGMVRFFEKILAEQKKQLKKLEESGKMGEILVSTLGYLSSHPATEDRIAEINKNSALKTVDYKELNYEFEELQNLVRDFVTESEQFENENNSEHRENLNESRN